MEITIDMAIFEKKAAQIGVFASEQLPFAISKTLNSSVFDARKEVVGVTWPSHMKVYNQNFINAAMRVDTSTKGNLSVSLYDSLHRASLALHADGGTKGSKGQLALPNAGQVARSAAGFSPRPRAIKLPNHTAKGHSVPSMQVIKGKGIFVGQGGRLVLAYAFRKSASIKKDFPFYEAFKQKIFEGCTKYYPGNVRAAIASAFGS
jgi:hypothetical protein